MPLQWIYYFLRVGKSLFGSSTFNNDRDFYIRRGAAQSRNDRTRDFENHSLNLARAGDQVRQMYS